MNKKEQVILEARKLFKKYGYKKVSMDEVAKKAQVTKKTIYTYFKDKEELFKYFIKEELDQIRQKIEQKEKENLPFIEYVSSCIYEMLKIRNESQLFNNVLEEFKNQENDNFLKLYDQEIIEYIESKLKKGIASKQIKECNTDLIAFIIYKVYIAIMFEYSKRIDEKKVTAEITAILKNNLCIREDEYEKKERK